MITRSIPSMTTFALSALFTGAWGCALEADEPALELREAENDKDKDDGGPLGYEVWGSDQSNSVAGETRRGVNGSWIWIWDGEDVGRQISGEAEAEALACAGMASEVGPCDVNEVFPAELLEFDAGGEATGETRPQIGRLHGMLVDPQNLYLTANLFAPGGAFLGIIDGRTKEAVALFRASATFVGRSNHMSFWDDDGSSIIIANLHGKILERINLVRDAEGNILEAYFIEGAGLGVAAEQVIVDRPKVYRGANLAGRQMLGTIVPGSPDMGALTPSGACRENGCGVGSDGALGGRPNNLIICPVPSSTTPHAYLTLAGGGLLVVDHSTTPMAIVGEYGNQVINGAGCGGVEAGASMFLNAGVSASGAGADQSTFTVYSLPTIFPEAPDFYAENSPAPKLVFADPSNTATNGRLVGPASNDSGQLPGLTTRRDSHGMLRSKNGQFVHTVDRIQNRVEVVRAQDGGEHIGGFDLISADGEGEGVGPCAAASVGDDPGLPTNDPTPDLMDLEPNGRYSFIAFRGPAPVSVTHGAQGSCPGVGVVELREGGRSGRLVTVLRSTNTVDTVEAGYAPSPGGHAYLGAERSDVHAAIVRAKVEDAEQTNDENDDDE